MTRTDLDRMNSELKAALGFTIALVVFEALVLHQGYVPYLFYPTVAAGRVMFGIGLVLLGYALTLAYVWMSLTATLWVRIVYFVVFALAVFVQYGFSRALRGFATADDLILVFSAWRNLRRNAEWAQLYVNWLAVIPCGAYAALLVATRSNRTTRWGTAVTVFAGLFVVNLPLTVLLSDRPIRNHRAYPTTSLNGFFRASMEVGVWQSRLALGGPRETVASSALDRPANNIVVIVDESMRGDHLSLNGYARNTTPTLDALDREGFVTNWGIAVSGSNCSLSANRLLWVGLPPTELPARQRQVWTWASLAQYARARGYRTHLFDGHRERIFWFSDTYMPSDSLDLRDIDHWMLRNSFPGILDADVDFAIAQRVGEIVDESTGNFIWVNKAGVHAPYVRSYPETAARWTPTEIASFYPFRPNGAPLAPLVNAYDNAVSYNVDGFFRQLDVRNRRPGTAFVYTSDHGQSLSEQNEPWTHCSNLRSGSVNRDREAMVPLLMIVAGEKARAVGNAFNRASHANVFATLLDLMAVPENARLHRYWPSLLAPTDFQFQGRYYFLADGIEGQSPSGGLAHFDEERLH